MKGAHYSKRSQQWEAKISVKGRTLYLGKFETELEAHAAYLKAAEKYGELRSTRKPDRKHSIGLWHI